MANWAKPILTKGFSKDVSYLFEGYNENKPKIALSYMILKKVMSHFNMFCTSMLDWIFRQVDYACVITQDQYVT